MKIRLLKSHALLFLSLITVCQIQAQTNTVLASESFNYTAGTALLGANGGTGWQSAWQVQDANTNIPGYNVSTITGSLVYPNITTSGNYAIGGYVYKNAGRTLSTSSFASYLNASNYIGKSGTTLYIAFIIRKDNSNDNSALISFNSNANAYDNSNPKITLGYGGAPSNLSGIRYWSLGIGSNYYLSNFSVTIGQPVFLVAKIQFGTTTSVNFYVNPDLSTGIEPATASVSQTTTTDVSFTNLRFYGGGGGTNEASLDEIKFGTSFSSVITTQITTTSGGNTGTTTTTGTSTNTVSGSNASAWNTNGNTGTTFPGNFLGTTDAQPLVIKTNNLARLTIDASGNTTIAGNTTIQGSTLLNTFSATSGNINSISGSYLAVNTITTSQIATTKIILPDGVLTSVSSITTPWAAKAGGISYGNNVSVAGTLLANTLIGSQLTITKIILPDGVITSAGILSSPWTSTNGTASYPGNVSVSGIVKALSIQFPDGTILTTAGFNTIVTTITAGGTASFPLTTTGDINAPSATIVLLTSNQINASNIATDQIITGQITLPDGVINSVSSLSPWIVNGNDINYVNPGIVKIGTVDWATKLSEDNITTYTLNVDHLQVNSSAMFDIYNTYINNMLTVYGNIDFYGNRIYSSGDIQTDGNINTSGNVGIGITTIATEKLQVAGNVKANGYKFYDGSVMTTAGIANNASNLTITGNIKSASATITNITATSVNVQNLVATNLTTTGGIIAGSIKTSGTLQAGVVSTSGSIISSSVNTGSLQASNGTFTGSVKAATFVFNDGTVLTTAGIPSAFIISTIGTNTTVMTDKPTIIAGTLKLGTGSMYLNGKGVVPTQGTSGIDEIFTGNASQPLYLQYSNTGNTIINANGGNVGIGTAAPATKLHLQEAIGNNNAILEIEAISSGQAGLTLKAGQGTVNRATRIDFLNSVSSSIVPRWSFINDYGQNGINDFTIVDDYQRQLTILQGGFVGIGTTTPTERLEVNGNIKFTSEYNSLHFPTSIGLSGGVTGDDLNYKKLTLYHGNSIVFETGSNVVDYNYTKMVINSNGNVGIGTTTPNEKLEVNGKIVANAIKFPDGTELSTASLTDTYWTLSKNIVYLTAQDDRTCMAINGNVVWQDPNGKLYFPGDNTLGYCQVGHDMSYADCINDHFPSDKILTYSSCTQKNSSALSPIEDTQVIIGANSLSNNYIVGIGGNVNISGMISVGDRVDAREFRACLDPISSCPPDYVFESDYKLMGLDTLKTYLIKNKHLPEVPSAHEMLSNGLNMKEMNLTLLKKVEELTLYLLKKDEEMKEMRKEIENIKTAKK